MQVEALLDLRIVTDCQQVCDTVSFTDLLRQDPMVSHWFVTEAFSPAEFAPLSRILPVYLAAIDTHYGGGLRERRERIEACLEQPEYEYIRARFAADGGGVRQDSYKYVACIGVIGMFMAGYRGTVLSVGLGVSPLPTL